MEADAAEGAAEELDHGRSNPISSPQTKKVEKTRLQLPRREDERGRSSLHCRYQLEHEVSSVRTDRLRSAYLRAFFSLKKSNLLPLRSHVSRTQSHVPESE